MMSAYGTGFALGASLILAIGAQNAFVLRQGLRGEHVTAVCLVCAVSDAVLILFGVTAMRELVERSTWIEPAMLALGSAFLLAYAARSAWSAWRAGDVLTPAESRRRPLAPTLATCLALTWLNPHVYLDTVLLLGSVSTGFPGRETVFAAGAITASCAFFFALGHGAALLRPWFARPLAWRWLDAIIALVMGYLGLMLILRGSTLISGDRFP